MDSTRDSRAATGFGQSWLHFAHSTPNTGVRAADGDVHFSRHIEGLLIPHRKLNQWLQAELHTGAVPTRLD